MRLNRTTGWSPHGKPAEAPGFKNRFGSKLHCMAMITHRQYLRPVIFEDSFDMDKLHVFVLSRMVR
jgi:hypothetical protein